MEKYTLALLAFFLVLSLSVEGWAGPPEPADTRTIERWAATLVAFGAGNPIFPGIRQAGTPADDQATQWLADMFQKFGLEQVRREPVPMAGWQPTAYGLTVHTSQGDVKLDAWPIFLRAVPRSRPRDRAARVHGRKPQRRYGRQDRRGRSQVPAFHRA